MGEVAKIEDNRNPHAKIGFVIYYPFQYFVYKNVYKHLFSQAEFIIDLGVFFPRRQSKELIDDVIAILRKNNVYFRILRYEDYYHNIFQDDFFAQYSALVSVWMNGLMSLKTTSGIRKIFMNYGVGKELATFALWKKNFDLILAYGDFDQKFYSLMTHSVIVGNPKFDDWFTNNFDQDLLKKLEGWRVPNRLTILYLPTHSDLSSISDIADELKLLSSQYNIITKLHYFTPREEPEVAEKLVHEGVLLLKDDVDLLALFHISDVVLSDNSSVIFDAILADKPIIVTDFHSEDYLNTTHTQFRSYPRGSFGNGALTYSGSIEQKIKKDGTVSVIKHPDELREAISISLRDNPSMKEKRADLRRNLFGFFDGDSGKRGAEAIKRFISDKTQQEKPLLYHAIDSFVRRKEQLWSSQMIAANLAGNNELENFPQNKDVIVSIILIDNDKSISIENKVRALSSIFLSIATSTVRAELFILTIDEKQLRECIKQASHRSDQASCHIITVVDSWGGSCKEAIDASTSEFLFFTTTSCIVSKKWIVKFLVSYGMYPKIVGVGGYMKKEREYTIFDEYDYFLIGRSLRIPMDREWYNKMYEVRNAILSQNPSGKLKNSSYKKKVFMKNGLRWESLDTIEMIEAAIRFEAFKLGSVLFLPSLVVDLEEMNVRRFRQKNFNIGMAYYFIAHAHPARGRYYAHPIRNMIQEIMTNIWDGYWKFTLTRVIFIAGISRLFGYYYARIRHSVLFLNEVDEHGNKD